MSLIAADSTLCPSPADYFLRNWISVKDCMKSKMAMQGLNSGSIYRVDTLDSSHLRDHKATWCEICASQNTIIKKPMYYFWNIHVTILSIVLGPKKIADNETAIESQLSPQAFIH